VIRPNAAHDCDYFVHNFNLTQEQPGRSGRGGRAFESLGDSLARATCVQREAPPNSSSSQRRRPTVVFYAEQKRGFIDSKRHAIRETTKVDFSTIPTRKNRTRILARQPSHPHNSRQELVSRKSLRMESGSAEQTRHSVCTVYIFRDLT
jgi:hypothetical protein